MPRRAKSKLTHAAIAKLKPRDARYEIHCGAIEGFIVRVNPSGTKTAYVRYWRDDRYWRVRIGQIRGTFTFEDARMAAMDLRAAVSRGEHPARERDLRRDAPTFAEVAERYMKLVAGPVRKPSTLRGYEKLLRKHLMPAFGRMKIGEIDRADVQRFHQRIGETSPGAANRALALVSVIMTNAERWGLREGRMNPCYRIEKKEGRKMERRLSGEERARLDDVLTAAEAAPKGSKLYVAAGSVLAVRLLSLTGARSGEITGLQWSMVDLERTCLRLPDSKTGAKIVPLTPAAVDLLRDVAKRADPAVPWVCAGERGGPANNLRRAWLALRSRAQIDDVRLHDLRHSAASDAVDAGVPLPLLGAVLGHKHPQTTQRYAHVNDTTMQKTARAMGEAIERSTREGAERLQQQRAVGADQGEAAVSDGADVLPIDGGKVLRFPGKPRG